MEYKCNCIMTCICLYCGILINNMFIICMYPMTTERIATKNGKNNSYTETLNTNILSKRCSLCMYKDHKQYPNVNPTVTVSYSTCIANDAD